MKLISTSLEHRVVPPEAGRGGTSPALILLHGRGADEEDLLGLAPAFDKRLLLIAPRAPFSFPGGGYTWYELGTAATPDPGTFRESYDRLSTFLDDTFSSYPIDPARVFLFGFSMGTAMAYAAALTRPGLFRGVSAASGYIPEHTHLAFRWKELPGADFCITHGLDDPVIPAVMAHRARDLISASGARCMYREYAMGHQISEQSLADILEWMAGLL
jgi:phospholipase/carboxylesterase